MAVHPYLKCFHGKRDKAEKKQLVEMHLSMGQDSEKQGDLREAMKQYELALMEDPENQEAIKGKERVKGKLWESAQRHYQKGLKYYKAGKYGLARQQFQRALDFWPDHTQARKMLDTRRDISAKGYVLHTIKPGESLSKVAKIYYGDYRQFPVIAEYNNFTDATKVKVGQKIKVPKIEGMPFFEKKQDPGKEIGGAKSPTVALPPEKEGEDAAALSPDKEGEEDATALSAEKDGKNAAALSPEKDGRG